MYIEWYCVWFGNGLLKWQYMEWQYALLSVLWSGSICFVVGIMSGSCGYYGVALHALLFMKLYEVACIARSCV